MLRAAVIGWIFQVTGHCQGSDFRESVRHAYLCEPAPAGPQAVRGPVPAGRHCRHAPPGTATPDRARSTRPRILAAQLARIDQGQQGSTDVLTRRKPLHPAHA